MNSQISVVIPTKNRPHYLKRLLNPFKYFAGYIQIIVVDDGSDPLMASQNEEICSILIGCEYHYITKSRGAAAARNFGLRMCGNDYVWFIDDDDQVLENTIRKVLRELSAIKTDVILLPRKLMYKNLVLDTVFPKPDRQNYEYYRKYGHTVNTSCAILRRECVLEIEGWDEKLIRGEDTSLFLSLSRRYNFTCLNVEPIIVNVGHSARMTRSVLKQELGKLQFLKKHWNDLSLIRKIYYITSFLIFLPAFLPIRLRWKVYKAMKSQK